MSLECKKNTFCAWPASYKNKSTEIKLMMILMIGVRNARHLIHTNKKQLMNWNFSFIGRHHRSLHFSIYFWIDWFFMDTKWEYKTELKIRLFHLSHEMRYLDRQNENQFLVKFYADYKQKMKKKKNEKNVHENVCKIYKKKKKNTNERTFKSKSYFRYEFFFFLVLKWVIISKKNNNNASDNKI